MKSCYFGNTGISSAICNKLISMNYALLIITSELISNIKKRIIVIIPVVQDEFNTCPYTERRSNLLQMLLLFPHNRIQFMIYLGKHTDKVYSSPQHLMVSITHYHLPDQPKPVLPPSNKSEYYKVHLASRPANIVNISRLTCRPTNTEKMTFQPTNITMYQQVGKSTC